MKPTVCWPPINTLRGVCWMLGALCLTVTGCSNLNPGGVRAAGVTGAGNQAAFSESTDYRIQSLDVLQITVFGETDLSTKTKVTTSGKITYPLLGPVKVGGLTVAEAEAKLTQLLDKKYLVNPKVNVTVAQSSSRRVIVLGQIKTPGTYDIPTDEKLTLLQAIAHAGGFTDIAAPDRVNIIRTENGAEQKLRVNAAAIMKGRTADVDLKPGDVVSVPETLF